WHTSSKRDWSSDVCSSDLRLPRPGRGAARGGEAELPQDLRAGLMERTPKRRRPPLDPRLVREVASARRHVARTVALGLVQAGCVIGTALVIARLGEALHVESAGSQVDRVLVLGV